DFGKVQVDIIQGDVFLEPAGIHRHGDEVVSPCLVIRLGEFLKGEIAGREKLHYAEFRVHVHRSLRLKKALDLSAELRYIYRFGDASVTAIARGHFGRDIFRPGSESDDGHIGQRWRFAKY